MFSHKSRFARVSTAGVGGSIAGMLPIRVVLLFGSVLASTVPFASADTFGSGANTFDIDFVTVGNPGNPADTKGIPANAGAVPYTYQMGKYEISEQMIDKANALGALGITKDTRGPDKPATRISWLEAAKFVNWINMSTGHLPAYKFDGFGRFQVWQQFDPGYNPDNPFRNSFAHYFLPSVDEWYKAAYYDPIGGIYYRYPTGSSTLPTLVASGTMAGTGIFIQETPADITQAGGLSPYGTMAQGGNVEEWNETALSRDFSNLLNRVVRGGDWTSGPTDALSNKIFVFGELAASSEPPEIGFRVAAVVPEPSTISLFAAAVLLVLLANFRRVANCGTNQLNSKG